MSEYFLPKPEIVAVGDYTTLTQTRNWGMVDLNVPEAWKTTQGEGVTIAVVDSGACNHSDVVDNIDLTRSKSFIEGEDIFDSFVGHGCMSSGIIASINDTKGVVGCAPKSTIISVKVLDKNGTSRTDSIAKGLQYCIDIKPDIVNMSLGGNTPDNVVHDKIKMLVDMGIPVVVAAGNTGKEPLLYPAGFPETFAIGSYSPSSIPSRSIFSSFGNNLTFSAPGEEILSTYLNEQYSVQSGTSFACPVVTGIIALLLSKYKKEGKRLTVEQIKQILIDNCIDEGVKGWDKEFGYGKINVPRLINGPSVTPVVKKWWQKLFFWIK